MRVALTQERLKELLDYNETTGVFTWRVKPSCRINMGSIAGSNSNGYISIKVDDGRYQAHRLAWFYKYGKWPIRFLDHKDTIRNHNYLSNLREATQYENELNCPLGKNNTSGQRGVSYHIAYKKWQVQLSIKHKKYYLGRFNIKEEAIKVAKDFILNNHGDFMYV